MTTMLVFVPGAASNRSKFRPLLAQITAGQPHCVVRPWDRAISLLTRADLSYWAEDLGGQIENWIRKAADDGAPVDDLLIVGHSIGGLVAREAFIQACEGSATWAPLVRRIVLLATPNRGVDPKRQQFLSKLAIRGFGWAFSDRFVWKQSMLGAAFVTNLRIRWIRQFHELEFEAPYVAQLRAEHDDLVHREDSRDIEHLRQSAEIVVSGSTHANLASLDGPREAVDQRVSIIMRALFDDKPIVTNPEPLPSQGGVALIVHGIRAGKRGWPADVVAALEDAAPDLLACSPSYGYLPAFDFAVPPLRRARRRWIRDVYSDLVAKYPTATFHYVGHSNGTYLLSKLLETAPGAKFESVFLAGCVLRRDYPWSAALDSGSGAQVGRVLNVRASTDVPVGWLCSALRGIGMKDLGTAGLDGFDDENDGLNDPYCVAGGHGTALSITDAPARIAQWVTTGAVVRPPDVHLTDGPRAWFTCISRLLGNPFLILALVSFAAIGIAFDSALLLVCAAAAGLVLFLRVI